MFLVNLYGAPGAGKSSGAAYIFSKLKMAGVNAELVTEFAKDKVYEQSKKVFENQAYIFGKQYFRITRCQDDVDVIITDSPLPLSIIYNKDPVLGATFNQLVREVISQYETMDYFVFRDKPYNPKGRFQNEEESNKLAEEIFEFLELEKITFCPIKGNEDGYDKIVRHILERLGKNDK